MLYHFYEFAHAAMNPARMAAGSAKLIFQNPFNPFAHTSIGRGTAAAAELIERTTRRYEKPAFGIDAVSIGGRNAAVRERVVWRRPFCRLVHFSRDIPEKDAARSPRILIVAPLSGHYATLLRGTVEGLLPSHDVYITDWIDARMVPAAEGPFDLDVYVDYLIDMIRLFKGDVHVMAVCQPSVPVLTAVSYLEMRQDADSPRSMILLGGPIDTRISPTAVNRLAQEKGIDWFRQNVVTAVPWPYPGRGRQVYPGFLQLTGFISMNMDRHVSAHRELFFNLVKGDGDSAEKHREFYDEYLAVMDLTAEYYLQTVETVFIEHALPKGKMHYRGRPIDPSAVRRVALMTVEGEKDDITGIGQCEAAHRLCSSLPKRMRRHHLQPKAGHYGIFNGSRFRSDIVPAMETFILRHDPRGGGLVTRLLRQIRNVGRIDYAAAPPALEIDVTTPETQPCTSSVAPVALKIAANGHVASLHSHSARLSGDALRRIGQAG
ncbi:MAG: polyhydroxyalkanoate depolymerase [Rhodomicrobium sp.]|nr:polyhydroxyalkanoate depolymerase [Rhodomicrobium sp.]